MSIAKVNPVDNLRFNVCHVLPYFLRGVFLRRRLAYTWLHAFGANPYSHAFGAYLVRKYRSKRLLINVAGRESLLLLDVDDVRHVLDHSPEIYAENDLKRRGMSHFQPHSVTISHGDAWRRRRAFNENVLDSGNPRHRLSKPFSAAIQRATQNGDATTWEGISSMFEEIMLSVVFGHSQRQRSLSALHRRLMRRANWLFGSGASVEQARQAAEIRALLLRRDGADALVDIATLPFDNHALQAENQVPHWMFAIRDTLATNCARALALLTGHGETLTRSRESLHDCDLSNPEHIGRLHYIEGGLQEAMRLWPSTPILARESLRRDALGEDEIAAGTQVVVFNQYLHRERESVADGDRFQPERWRANRTDARFNHLSNGRQVCAGKDLALFLGTAVLANLISQGYVLRSPALDSSMPVPVTFNYFRLRFSRTGG